MAPRPSILICVVRFVSSNNEISGKGLRPVLRVLLEQAMSPLYLSSSGWGGGWGGHRPCIPAPISGKRKKTLPSSLSCSPLPLENLCLILFFFFKKNLHILQYGLIAHDDHRSKAVLTAAGGTLNGILTLNGVPASGPHLASNDKVSSFFWVMKAFARGGRDVRKRTGGQKGGWVQGGGRGGISEIYCS